MDIGGFHHLAIQVCDLERAERFYAGVLGLRVIARHADAQGAPRAIWVQAGEGFLALELAAGAAVAAPFRDPTPGLFLLALRIERAERATWERRLAEAGHPKVAETAFTFYVRDPEGNRIGLSHHPHPREGQG